MSQQDPVITVITPTTGKKSLIHLIETIFRQKVPVMHILLWDDVRDKETLNGFAPTLDAYDAETENLFKIHDYRVTNIVLRGVTTMGTATGSLLRSVGLMAANTPFITFADDDVMWEDGHLLSLLEGIQDKNWAYCKRKIWTQVSGPENPQFELIGVDNFESVGEDSKLSYKMVDNNCMVFRRRFGSSAAVLYRETTEYNDDRLMYDFLKTYAGQPYISELATVNQVCPDRLVNFFKSGCTKV